MRGAIAAGLALCVAGCGSSSDESWSDETKTAPEESSISCADLVDDVIGIAAQNGTNIVKIYKPEKIEGNDREPVCKGDALLSTQPERLPLYFKRMLDEDGQGIIMYSGEPLPDGFVSGE